MHIGFVTHHYPPGQSADGISTYSALMAGEMIRRGHTVTVFSRVCENLTADRDSAGDPRLRVHYVVGRVPSIRLVRVAYYRVGGRLFPGRVQSRKFGRGLREAVLQTHRKKPIDVLECPEVRGIPLWLETLRVPVIVRLHGACAVTWPYNGQRADRVLRGIARMERRCLNRAQFLSAPSHAVVEETRRALNLPLKNVRIVPNPTDTGLTHAGQGNGTNDRTILFVGSVDLLKGFDVLVRAFDMLLRSPRCSDIRLNVVGADHGLLLDGRHLVSGPQFVRQTIGDSEAASRIAMHGRLSYQEVQDLRCHRPITVVPSRFENFPNTVLEAMAAACSVVVSNVGGSREIIQHERNGLLFRSCDANDLAAQLERLLADTALRARLGDQARTDVAQRYDTRIVGDQMSAFLGEVVDDFCRGKTSTCEQ